MRAVNSSSSNQYSSDFSETFRQVELEQDSALLMNLNKVNANASYSRNVSSELSKIQDTGSAYSPLSSQEKNVKSSAINTGAINKRTNESDQYNSETGDDKRYEESGFLTKLKMTDKAIGKKIFINRNLVTLLILLFVTSIMSLVMMSFEMRSSKLERDAGLFNFKIQNILAQDENLSTPVAFTIDTKLQSMKDELKYVATKSNDADHQQTEGVAEQFSSYENELSFLKDDIVKMRNEVLSLKTQLNVVNNNYQTDSKKLQVKTVANISNSWVVNLASLKNKSKAEIVVKKLQEAGLSPQIQEAMIKGKRVYRLSVAGFLNLNEAQRFIQIADKKYGMKNGWVRKS